MARIIKTPLAALVVTLLSVTVAITSPSAASAAENPNADIVLKTGFRDPGQQPLAPSSADKARVLADQQRWLQQRAPEAGTTIADDLRTECELRDAQASSGPAGWLKDRMLSCIHRRPFVEAINVSTGAEVGELEFDVWVLGYANHGARQVDYLISVENFTMHAEDPSLSWPAVTLQGTLLGCLGAPLMNCPSSADLTDTVLGWQLRPSRGVFYTSDNNVGVGDFLTVSTRIQFNFLVVPAPGSQVRFPGLIDNIFESEIRFDSGGQSAMGRAHGSVFVKAPLIYRLWLSSQTHPQSALHVYDALNRPVRTFPSWPNKHVPGGENAPLHRLVDTVKTQANRNFTTQTCKDVWGPDYAKGGLECDEFPFASTYEGGLLAYQATGERRYSVRPIPAGDNNDGGGSRLKNFYNENRVLDNEAFYVLTLP